LTKKFNTRFLKIFFEYFTPENDLRTKRKSDKPHISSEKEIEKWPLRQSAKTVPLSKPVKYDKQRILFLNGSGGVESIAVSTLLKSVFLVRCSHLQVLLATPTF